MRAVSHMDEFRVFTLDPVNFPPEAMRAWIDELHANHQRNVLIVDPAMKNESG